MSVENASQLQPGQRVQHQEHGEGVVVSPSGNGFIRVFFGSGERQVPLSSLLVALGRSEQIIHYVATGEARARRAWLAYQAHALPLLRHRKWLVNCRRESR